MQNPPAPQINKNVTLLVMAVGGFITTFMTSAINVPLPTIGIEFSADAVTLGWVASSFLLAAAIFLIPIGRLSDIYGRKKIYLAGCIIFTISGLMTALSYTMTILIISRVIQGIGASMIFGNTAAIISSAFPAGERGKALGMSIASTYFGLSLGPFIGGFMTQYLGWRSLFWFNVVVGILLVILTLWKLKADWVAAHGEKFDLTGSLIYAVGLTAVMIGFSELPDWLSEISLAAGIAILLIFIWFESKVESPALDLSLFRHNRVFAFSNLAAFINYGATFAVSFLLSLYLQYIKGMSPSDSGIVLVAMPVVQAVLAPVTGRLSDRREPRVLATIGMAITAAGLLMLVFLDNGTQLWYIIACLILIGTGFGLFSPTNINAIMSSVPHTVLGVAGATLGTMRLTGQMFSMGIATLLLGIFIGRVAVTPEYYPQFILSQQLAFIIFTVLCIGGIFASFARGNKAN
jgi:EmrB/QacA subfamily drug resistance transporter